MSIRARTGRILLGTCLATLTGASVAEASTWIVDIANGPGAQFTQIKDAVAAAQPGDVILVRPGAYLPLRGNDKLQKGVTILGQGVVSFSGNYVYSVEIANVPTGQSAVLVNLSGYGWSLSGNQGNVTIRESKAGYGILATQCADLRVHQMSAAVGTVSVQGSRVEIVDCTILGRSGDSGQSCNAWWPATSGSSAIWASGSTVHLVRSSAFGGAGGDGPQPGNGGDGATVSSSTLIIDGGGVSTIRGGLGGWGDFCVSFYDGNCGHGVRASAGSVIRWGASLQGVTPPPGFLGSPGLPIVLTNGATDQQVIPDSPMLTFDHAPVPGYGVVLRVDAPPGTAVRLNLGREPQVVPTPGVWIAKLLVWTQTFDLGTVPPSGRLLHRIRIPARLHSGDRLFAQAQNVDPATGEVRRSSSAVLVVR